MNTEEVREEKVRAEAEIKESLVAFADRTGAVVRELGADIITYWSYDGDSHSVINAVRISAEV